MLVCMLLGLAIERVAYRPLRRAPRLTALITAIVYRSCCQIPRC